MVTQYSIKMLLCIVWYRFCPLQKHKSINNKIVNIIIGSFGPTTNYYVIKY
jgi:hypothetical protein